MNFSQVFGRNHDQRPSYPANDFLCYRLKIKIESQQRILRQRGSLFLRPSERFWRKWIG